MEAQVESDCWQAYRRNKDTLSRDRLFSHYQLWAEIEARRLFGCLSISGADLEEFFQWAYQGMLEAIERFDPNRQITFKAFAVHRVRGAILTALPRLSEFSAFYAQRGRYLESTDALCQPDISAETGEPVSLLVGLVMELSVDYLLQDANNSLTQLTGDFYSSPEISTIGQRIRDNVDTLSEPMRSIIKLYYFDDLAFGQIAKLVGLSNGRVSQLHKKAIAMLSQRSGW